MVTHFIGNAEVDAYLRDLIIRISDPNERPRVWVFIGPSGDVLAKRLLGMPEATHLADTRLFEASYDRATDTARIETEGDDAKFFGERVLVIDSSVHSGSTMYKVVREALKHSPLAVSSYSLVLKRNSTFVPTFWALTIDDHDRALFLLDTLPNNHLSKPLRGVFLRKLSKKDLDTLAPIECGLNCFDKVTWADRWYDIRLSEKQRCTYLLQRGDVTQGYITVVSDEEKLSLTIDEIVVATEFRKTGCAGIMLRFAETLARQMGASVMQMWGIDDKVEMYEHFGYQKVRDEEPMRLDGHEYFFMSKRIVHHEGSRFQF